MERPTSASRSQQLMTAVVFAVSVLALSLGGYRAILTAVADWRFRAGDLRSIESAERIMPSSARYHFARALAIQQADPTSAEVDRELSQAVTLNPRFSDAMLSWSVDREFSGDKKGAENLLLDARRVDRLFRPSWALANFYYRQGDSVRFWPQARECLRLIGVASFTTGRYDPVPVFQLCWSMQPDAPAILSKAIPDNPQIEQIYLSYLLKTGHVDAQVALTARMLQRPASDDLWVLIPHINTLIGSSRIDQAVRTWNALIDRKLLPFSHLIPARGLSLTNGGLLVTPSGAGFDWRPLYPESVRFTFVESEHTYRFEFDGTEPERLDLISQFVPLLPHRTYQFSARYRAGFDAWNSGLKWTVTANYVPIPVRVVGVSGTDDKTAVLEFQTPGGISTGNLMLSYARQPGTTILHGPFDLLQASLKLL